MATVNPTTLRTQRQSCSVYLSLLQPVTLLTALVNNLAITRGARSIAYDTGSGSGFATITEGQTLEVDTADGTYKIRVKSITGNQTSGTITVDENGIVWADGQTIRIKHNYEVHPIPPAIRSGVFYKFYNTAYTDQNEEPSPVAIAGSHRVGFLSAGSVVFNLAGGSSYAIANGATISSYLWACIRNGGGTTGITIASAASASTTLTITTAGQYWLSLTVTDSNGKTMTTYRAVFVYDTSTQPYTDFTIQSLSGDWNAGGWRLSLNATGSVSLSTFPDNTLAVLWYTNYFDGVEGYINLWGVSDNVIMAGYLRQDTDRDDFGDGTGVATFQISTIDDLLNNTGELGSVSLNAVSNPDVWYEYASWMTTGRSIHHLLRWQAWGVFQTCDVYGLTSNTLGVKSTDYTESSLLQQVNGFAYGRGIFAKLMCDRLGRLHLVEDSQMLNDAGRAALDTVFTLAEADISGVVDVARQPEQSITFTQLDGFSFNGTTSTPFISILPGYRESSISYIIPEIRGGATAAVSNQVLNNQTDANEKVGRYHALQNNNPRELRFNLPYCAIGAFDVIPSIGWYNWGIADADLKRNTEMFGRLFICRNISHQFVYGDGGAFTGFIQSSVVLEPEAVGPDGIQGNYPLGYPTPALPTPDWTPAANAPAIFAFRDQNDGQGKAFVANAGSVTIGSIVTFETGGTEYVSVCALSATKAVVCYRDTGNSNRGTACVLDVSGTVITAGTPAVFETGNTTYVDVCALSPTQAVVCYRDVDNTNRGTACVLDVSGSTVTPGTPAVFETGSTRDVAAVGLTSTRAFVCYADVGNSNFGTGCVLDVSGSTVTPGTPDVWWGAGVENISADAIDSSSVIVTWEESGPHNLDGVILYDIVTGFTSSGAVNLGGAHDAYDSAAATKWVRVANSTNAIVVYQESTSFRVYGVAISISGIVITGGTPVEIGSFTGSYDSTPTLALASTTKAIVFYEDQNTPSGRILTIDFAAGVITENADEIAVSGDPLYTSSATLEN